MTEALKPPQVAIHPLFNEYKADEDEIKHFVAAFLSGESGDFEDEDEILGFLEKDLKGKLHHGVYETTTSGRIHVLGDREKIMVMPDIAFAEFDRGMDCSINACKCADHNPKPYAN